MPHMSGFRLFVMFYVVFLGAPSFLKAEPPRVAGSPTTLQAGATGVQWSAPEVQHVYGLPEVKPHQKGALTLTADNLTFTGKSGADTVPRSSITAVSVGNERVELFGMTGRIVRMAIPDNGGLAIASFAHHRIDMLTVKFTDVRGGAHSAVFFLGANRADQAIEAFAVQPKSDKPSEPLDCEGSVTDAGSMLIAAPDWNGADVPPVYQGLVYEHLVDRFRKAKGLTRVYREGESIPSGLCPQYTMHLSVTGFKLGSSVERAMLGPVGMFVGTTQMMFDAKVTDRAEKVHLQGHVKATIRDESESTSVADKIAKALEKNYEKALKASEQGVSAQTGTANP